MCVKVFPDNAVFVNEVFANGTYSAARGSKCFFVFYETFAY